MKYLFLAFLMAWIVAAPAAAQQQDFRAAQVGEQVSKREAAPDAPVVRHVSDWLNDTPQARQALAEYHRRKALGLLDRAGKDATYTIGEVQTFKVYNFEESTGTNAVLDDLEFELKRESDRFMIWVEVAELTNGNVTEDDIDALFTALNDQTPPNSIDPNAGIIVNDETVFGDPPDIDGDGKSDVLLVDVRDGSLPFDSFVAGFAFSGDLSDFGNERDVLYLDTEPALDRIGIEGVSLTAAHEYHHVIHFNYSEQFGIQELSFVNEGLSEWAEVMNGYRGRRIDYLGEADRYNVPLLRFSANSDPNVLDDYQRAGLWTTYVAERIGVETGRITRDRASGSQGYRNVLEDLGLTLEDVLSDFHIANFLNDTSLDPRYGYAIPERAALAGAAPLAVYDGRLANETATRPLAVDRGAAQYVVWDKVEDFTLMVNTTTGGANLRGTALLFQDGAFEARPVDFGQSATLFSGVYDRIVIVFSHIDPDGERANLNYSATWTAEVFQLENIVYDDGMVPSAMNDSGQLVLEAFVLCSGPTCDSRQANRFDHPAGGILTSVTVGPYFDHDFSGSNQPDNAPRDFQLTVWDDDGTGSPGAELFTLDVTDSRASSGSGGNLNFQTIDLSAFQNELAALPGTIYIGLTNTGSDQNYLVMGVTAYEGNTSPDDNVSFLYLPSFNNGQGAWAPFPNLQSGGENILMNRVLPIRAAFLVPTGPVAVEDDAEVPSRIVLHPNFPNPFNPTTTIRYSLPQAADVTLAVYDLLGRQMALLVDGVLPPGEHQAQIDGSDWASGLYFYTLQTADQRLTQRMVLIK